MHGLTINTSLVADIGGTNARFGVATYHFDSTSGQLSIRVEQQHQFACADFSDIDELVEAYQHEIGELPQHGCFAIAGPIQQQHVKMTNLQWQFATADVAKRHNMASLTAINDFAGMANAAPFLQDDERIMLKPGTPEVGAPMAILGPGTGFGVAALVPTHDKGWVTVSSEGGHAAIAATSELEHAVLQQLYARRNFVSIEDCLCGRGLVLLYEQLAAIKGQTVRSLQPADVTQLGLSGEDALCREALILFVNWLGSVVADKALTYGARGGVYLAGGILPRLQSLLPETEFTERFLTQGRMRSYLESIPVQLMIASTPALTGAAAWLWANGPSKRN